MKKNDIITNYSEDSIEYTPTLAKTLRVIKTDIVDSEYTLRIGSEAIRNNTGVRIVQADQVFSAPQLTNGITSSCFVNIPRPSSWGDGIIGVRWHLTGDTSSTNIIYVRTSMFCFGATSQIGTVAAGELVPAYSFDTGTFTSVAGPAAKWKRVLFESNELEYVVVDQSVERVYARILRDGAHASDTYGGEAYVLGCELQYIPKRSQS